MKKKNLEYNDFNLINTVRVFFTNVYNYYATIVYYLFFFYYYFNVFVECVYNHRVGLCFLAAFRNDLSFVRVPFFNYQRRSGAVWKKKNHCPDGFLVYFNRTRTIIIIRESDEVVYRSGFVIFNV